jgi:hypothetical protein
VRQCASEFDFFISRTGKAPIHRYGFPPQASEAEKACMLSATALGNDLQRVWGVAEDL